MIVREISRILISETLLAGAPVVRNAGTPCILWITRTITWILLLECAGVSERLLFSSESVNLVFTP